MGFIDVIDIRRAAEYVKEQLLLGTTLANLAAQSIDLSRGSYRVAMPVTKAQGVEFDLRWETFRLAGDEENCFARLIKSFICNEECNVILQDTETSTSYPYFGKLPYRKLALPYAEEVYWNVADAKLANLSDEEMSRLINHASFWPFSVFFYTDGISAKGELQNADLQLIVKHLVGLAVGAFDDRSYLVWWRDDLRPFPQVA
jgi:hypothetical protein